ncbi:deaminase domain-containing protein [Priestia megaterium]
MSGNVLFNQFCLDSEKGVYLHNLSKNILEFIDSRYIKGEFDKLLRINYFIGNIGVAFYNIDGIGSETIYAHSKIHKNNNHRDNSRVDFMTKNGIMKFATQKVGGKEYPAMYVNSSNKVAEVNKGTKDNKYFKRDVDSEYKIVHYLLRKIEKKRKEDQSYEPKGDLYIYTDRPCCPSCENVLSLFGDDFKNLKIVVYHNRESKK